MLVLRSEYAFATQRLDLPDGFRPSPEHSGRLAARLFRDFQSEPGECLDRDRRRIRADWGGPRLLRQLLALRVDHDGQMPVNGAWQAERLLQRHQQESGSFPESIAMVLWGTDNLKSEGGPIAQALALMGAQPRFDTYGRLAGAQLIPLDVLGRARVDVLITLSEIGRAHV